MSQRTGIAVDPAKDVPLYQQIFDEVVERIRSGTWPEGFRLPPTRALCDELGAHRNTVVRAYADLEAAGFVNSTVGRGTFVAALAVKKRPLAPAPSAGSITWASMLSTMVSGEALSRLNRVRRRGLDDSINLARMEPSTDLLPGDLIQRCIDHVMRTHGSKSLGYVAREGLHRLRVLIAEDVGRRGVPATPDDLIITTGSQQALDLIARALINPGDAFLVDHATYHGAVSLLSAAGARLISVPIDDEGPQPEALERLGRVGAKGFYLMPNCNNPTTARISDKRREVLVSWSKRYGVPLIEDDYAADLTLTDNAEPISLRALDGDVIYTGTYSKKLAPALRIGFVLAPPALRPHLLALKQAMDLGTSLLLQHTLAEFLERGYMRAHLGRVVPEYRQRAEALDQALRAALPSTWRWTRPRAGVALWLPLPDEIAPEHLYDEAARAGVQVSPSTLNATDARPQPGIRLTFCAEPVPRLVEGAKRLGHAISQLGTRPRRATQDDSITGP